MFTCMSAETFCFWFAGEDLATRAGDKKHKKQNAGNLLNQPISLHIAV